MGAEYIRSTPVPDQVEVNKEDTVTIDIENISTPQTIGNSLDIHLRQKADQVLPWVQLTQGSPSQVNISPNGTPTGEYELVLESFDQNSVVKAALFTDNVIIKVKNEIKCIFKET